MSFFKTKDFKFLVMGKVQKLLCQGKHWLRDSGYQTKCQTVTCHSTMVFRAKPCYKEKHCVPVIHSLLPNFSRNVLLEQWGLLPEVQDMLLREYQKTNLHRNTDFFLTS